MANRIRHASIVKIVFDSKIIGTMTNVTWNEDYGLQGQYAIGELGPVEITALRFSGDFSYQKLVLSDDLISDIKAFQRTNQTSKQIAESIVNQEGFTMVFEDKKTTLPIATINGCKTGNISMSVGANAVVNQGGRGLFGTPATL